MLMRWLSFVRCSARDESSRGRTGIEIRRTARACKGVQVCGTEITLISYTPSPCRQLYFWFDNA